MIGNDLSSVDVKGLAPLTLGRTKTIFNTKTRSQSINVLSQEFHTQDVIEASDRVREEEATEEDLLRVNADYYFDPDQDVVQASDLVELKP